MSIRTIHIFGASGSGTTALASEIATQLGWTHFDTDDYFWLPTDPPYSEIRSVEDRLSMLRLDLPVGGSWILSGALDGWGDSLIPLFDLVIFLYVPCQVRLQRLKEREIERFGATSIVPGGKTCDNFRELISWASKYDTAGHEMRSLVRHRTWFQRLDCAKLTIEGIPSVIDSVAQVMEIVGRKLRHLWRRVSLLSMTVYYSDCQNNFPIAMTGVAGPKTEPPYSDTFRLL